VSRRYHRDKEMAKATKARTAELERRAAQQPVVCAYCGGAPAKRCPAGDGRHVVYRCADCWPKTVA
jgi:DNA-directed RNA polymerase subunit RPC12/RpoP